MSKFTKGPWIPHQHTGLSIFEEATSDLIASLHSQKDVHGYSDSISVNEAKANARLIAAAPKLYSVLEAIKNECNRRDVELGYIAKLVDDALSEVESE